jgi:hypothetical protein
MRGKGRQMKAVSLRPPSGLNEITRHVIGHIKNISQVLGFSIESPSPQILTMNVHQLNPSSR